MSALDTRPEAAGPTSSTFDVSIVLPCKDEEGSVATCVHEALDACVRAGLSAEVVVVDNNSSDRSAVLAGAAGARVISETTAGYGAAIRAGIRSARAPVVVMADADCSYPLNRIAELVQPIRTGDVDIMVGGRLSAATRHSMPLLHRLVGTPALTYLVREGSGMPALTDSQSGFRAFRRDTIISLGLKSTGMEFASEMLIRATQHDLRVEEIALGYRERVGKSKLDTWSDGLRHLRLIVRLSPHLVLWYPGGILMACALALFAVSLVDPAALRVGSATWQPIFFCSTLLVFGLGGMLAGAVVAYHSPVASRRLRATFSWIADPVVTRRMRRGGVVLALVGVGLNAGLYVLSFRHVATPLQQRLTLSGMAQSLLLCGTLLAVFAVLYPMVRAATVNDIQCDDEPELADDT